MRESFISSRSSQSLPPIELNLPPSQLTQVPQPLLTMISSKGGTTSSVKPLSINANVPIFFLHHSLPPYHINQVYVHRTKKSKQGKVYYILPSSNVIVRASRCIKLFENLS